MLETVELESWTSETGSRFSEQTGVHVQPETGKKDFLPWHRHVTTKLKALDASFPPVRCGAGNGERGTRISFSASPTCSPKAGTRVLLNFVIDPEIKPTRSGGSPSARTLIKLLGTELRMWRANEVAVPRAYAPVSRHRNVGYENKFSPKLPGPTLWDCEKANRK